MFVLCSLVSKLIFQSVRWHHSSTTEARSLCFSIWLWFLPVLSCIVTTLILRLLFRKAMIFCPCLQCVHAAFVLTRPAHLEPAYQTLTFCCRNVFFFGERGHAEQWNVKLPYRCPITQQIQNPVPLICPQKHQRRLWVHGRNFLRLVAAVQDRPGWITK